MPSDEYLTRSRLRIGEAERQQLRIRTLDAVAECMGKLKVLHDDGHKFAKRSYPVRDPGTLGKYGKVEWSSSKGAPLSYKSAIGPSTSYDAVIPYSEIEGIGQLLDFVEEQPRLRSWLVPDDFGDEEWRRHIRAVGVADLPLEICDRHIHTAGWEINQVVLERLFAEMEAWWLNEELKVNLWIPILGVSFACDELILGVSARLLRLSDKEQLARWPGQRLDDQAAFVAMATHALVVSGWTMPNEHALQWLSPTNPPESIPIAEQFVEALAVVTEQPSGYVQAVIRPVGWAPGFVADLPVLLTGALIPDRRSTRLKPATEPSVTLTGGEVEQLRGTYQALSLHKEVALAARRLLSSDRRRSESDSIVDLCIGLEALLSDAQGETTYKIALRSVGILAERGVPDPSQFLAPMKTVYAYRSSVVHGRGSAKTASVSIGDKMFRTEDLARLVLRLSLETRIENPKLTPPEIDKQILGVALDMYSRRGEQEQSQNGPR